MVQHWPLFTNLFTTLVNFYYVLENFHNKHVTFEMTFIF